MFLERAVQVRSWFASMIEDDLQSNMSCLVRATQLSKKFTLKKKNEVVRGTSVCWHAIDGKRGSWGVPNRGISVHDVQDGLKAGNISMTTGSGADCVSVKIFAERLEV